MCDSILAIYCFIDDLLKAMRHKEDCRARFSDAEVMTTALIAMLYFGGNFQKSRSFLKSFGFCPRMKVALAVFSPVEAIDGFDLFDFSSIGSNT